MAGSGRRLQACRGNCGRVTAALKSATRRTLSLAGETSLLALVTLAGQELGNLLRVHAGDVVFAADRGHCDACCVRRKDASLSNRGPESPSTRKRTGERSAQQVGVELRWRACPAGCSVPSTRSLIRTSRRCRGIMRLLRLIAGLAFACALESCGGGGETSTTPVAPIAPPPAPNTVNIPPDRNSAVTGVVLLGVEAPDRFYVVRPVS
jgi:hypothetical protein